MTGYWRNDKKDPIHYKKFLQQVSYGLNVWERFTKLFIVKITLG
jgi:hypothetical protein